MSFASFSSLRYEKERNNDKNYERSHDRSHDMYRDRRITTERRENDTEREDNRRRSERGREQDRGYERDKDRYRGYSHEKIVKKMMPWERDRYREEERDKERVKERYSNQGIHQQRDRRERYRDAWKERHEFDRRSDRADREGKRSSERFMDEKRHRDDENRRKRNLSSYEDEKEEGEVELPFGTGTSKRAKVAQLEGKKDEVDGKADFDDDEDEDNEEDEETKIKKARERRQALMQRYIESNEVEHREQKDETYIEQKITAIKEENHATKLEVHDVVVAKKEATDSVSTDAGIQQQIALQAAEADDIFSGDAPLTLDSSTSTRNKNNPSSATHVSEMLDSWDDSEGYYRYRLGDILVATTKQETHYYRVCGMQGSGVFSTVLRVIELKAAAEDKEQQQQSVTREVRPEDRNEELVVKVIRNNETMYKAGIKELSFLQTLSQNDQHGKKHCVRLLSNFMHRGHLCLLFEPMSMDLRKLIKKFGSIGLSLSAVQSYSYQLLIGLKHLKKCNILHGDLKPDNLLVNHSLTQVKICDFGSASWLNECEITPYLVSRFYRAPEVMLGMEYNELIDLWSIGCSLYELYTGQILFNGKNNNEMLFVQQQLCGKIPLKMLKKAKLASQHFDSNGCFLLQKVDSATSATYAQNMDSFLSKVEGPLKQMEDLLKAHSGKLQSVQKQNMLSHLAEFIMQCLVIDPSRRPPVEVLLKHPFITQY